MASRGYPATSIAYCACGVSSLGCPSWCCAVGWEQCWSFLVHGRWWHLCDHGLVAPEAAPWFCGVSRELYSTVLTNSAVAVVALLMTMAAERCSAERPWEQRYTGNTAVHSYTQLYSATRLYSSSAGPAWESSPEEWSELDQPHSRARARARVTMRVRIMRARARVRAPARGDTPYCCSRFINGVEDYRRAVLGSSITTVLGSGPTVLGSRNTAVGAMLE